LHALIKRKLKVDKKFLKQNEDLIYDNLLLMYITMFILENAYSIFRLGTE